MSATSSEPTLGLFERISSWWYGLAAQSSTASPAETTESSVQESAQPVFNAQAVQSEKKGADLPPLFYRGKELEIRNLGMENTLKDLIAEVAREVKTTEDKVHIIFHQHEMNVNTRPEVMEKSIQDVVKTISFLGICRSSETICDRRHYL